MFVCPKTWFTSFWKAVGINCYRKNKIYENKKQLYVYIKIRFLQLPIV